MWKSICYSLSDIIMNDPWMGTWGVSFCVEIPLIRRQLQRRKGGANGLPEYVYHSLHTGFPEEASQLIV